MKNLIYDRVFKIKNVNSFPDNLNELENNNYQVGDILYDEKMNRLLQIVSSDRNSHKILWISDISNGKLIFGGFSFVGSANDLIHNYLVMTDEAQLKDVSYPSQFEPDLVDPFGELIKHDQDKVDFNKATEELLMNWKYSDQFRVQRKLKGAQVINSDGEQVSFLSEGAVRKLGLVNGDYVDLHDDSRVVLKHHAWVDDHIKTFDGTVEYDQLSRKYFIENSVYGSEKLADYHIKINGKPINCYYLSKDIVQKLKINLGDHVTLAWYQDAGNTIKVQWVSFAE